MGIWLQNKQLKTKIVKQGVKNIRRSITGKIIASYIFIIISALMIVGLVFGLLARTYAERQAKNQLIKDANAIYDVIVQTEASDKDITGAAVRQEIRKKMIGKIGDLESNFTLLSKDYKILYPKNEEALQFKEQILPRIQNKLDAKPKKAVSMKTKVNNQEYLLVILPPKGNVSTSLRGWVVLYDSIGPMQKLAKSMLLVLFISLLFTAVIAVIAGIIIARTIAKPIIALKSRAESLSRLDFEGKVQINTGDELEELGKAMDKMAVDLQEHDLAQKRFFQNASHELKTPLMSIQGYAEGLRDGVFKNDSEALDVIVDESKRLKDIVEQLIYLTKIESRDEIYKFNQESMNQIIELCSEKLEGLAAANNVKISTVPCEDVMLQIDREKIIQALINVIGNCLRYAQSEVSISTSTMNGWFELKIRDDGDGFDENELNKVFERFHKGKKGNSGLGLAITKAIVEKHTGNIAASNAPGGGALFQIRLPIK